MRHFHAYKCHLCFIWRTGGRLSCPLPAATVQRVCSLLFLSIALHLSSGFMIRTPLLTIALPGSSSSVSKASRSSSRRAMTAWRDPEATTIPMAVWARVGRFSALLSPIGMPESERMRALLDACLTIQSHSCPYITNVGATKIYPGHSVFEAQPEGAVVDPAGHPYSSAFSSGGGFSNIYPIPDYQAAAVAA